MKRMSAVRWLAVSIILALSMSLFACNGTIDQTTDPNTDTEQTDEITEPGAVDGPLTKYEEMITVTTARSINDAMQQMMGIKEDVLTENNWFKGYENDLGIMIEYVWTVPGEQYEQKINTQIAANDLPDIFLVAATQLKLLHDSGMIMDMTDIFDQYASDFTWEMMEADNHVALSQASFDGKLMALPNVSGNRDGASLMWIRQDWLDNLDMEAPTTIDELIGLADAFTNGDPNESNTNDTYGIALNKDIIQGGLNDLTGFFEGYGAYVNGWIKDSSGKVVSGLIQPEVKSALETLSMMYSEGYIDREFSAKDNSKASEDLVGGRAGITFGQHWIPFWPLQDAANADMNADWKPYPIPSHDGSPASVMLHGSAGNFYAINIDAENPEAAVKLYNYFYMKDCALSPDYDPTFHAPGTITLSERPEEAFEWAVIHSFYPMQNLFIHRGVKDYFNGDESVLENNWVKDNALQNEEYLQDPVVNRNLWASYRWSGLEGAFSVIDYYENQDLMLQNEFIMGNTESMMQFNATLEQMTLETFTKIIMGTDSIDSFDHFVEQWHNLGGNEITTEVNQLLSE